jgi:serine/threonine protein kinase
MFTIDDVLQYNSNWDILPRDLEDINKILIKQKRKNDRNYFHQLLPTKSLYPDLVIDEKYKLIHKLGKGAQGKVWKCENIIDKELLALKISEKSLYKEYSVMEQLKEIPYIGKHKSLPSQDRTKNLYYLPLQLLQCDLEHCFNQYDKTFPEEHIKIVGYNIMNILKNIHNKDYIYRDLSFKNIMMDENSNVYLVDFGLSIKINHQQHAFSGTYKFSSSNALKGGYVSFRDDIQSLFYILLYLHLGNEKWTFYDKKPSTDKDYQQYAIYRDRVLPAKLLTLPKYLVDFYTAVHNNDPIDYDKIKKTLINI